jgi:P22 coat protein - gene protein 5
MANSLLTIDMVTREALRIAHEKAQFIGTVDRQYDSSFANTGAKTGASLRVRKPNQYVRRTGSRVMNVQDQAESNGTITVATQDGVDMRFNSAELALSIDDFSKRYIEPAMAVLVSGIESDFLAFATKATWNVAGTAGTGITTLTVPGAARAKLNQGLAPKDGNRYVQMDSVTMGGMVEGLKGLFQDSTQIKEQYREGMIGRTGMADWYENERLWTMTMGSDVDTVTINDAGFVSGDTTVTITGSTGHAVGQVVTFAGCKAVHAETKAVFPHLQQFVITAVSGNDITISPTPVTSGATQNVNAMPANGAAVTFVGVNSASYIQPLMYHKEAFQFVTADLPLMDDAHKCVRRTHDGLSMRVWQGSDIVNDNLLMRIDILYGMAALRPEWACRLVGAAAA